MQRGKYLVKDVEASLQKPADVGYDDSFKMCVITIGVFLVICIILLLCTLPLTSHHPLPESQSQPGTDTHKGDRPDITGEENPYHWPVPEREEAEDYYSEESEEDNDSHISNTSPGHRRKISNTITQATVFKFRTATERNSLQEVNEDVHTVAENGRDSSATVTHHEPTAIADTDTISSEVEHELENGNENDQLPPESNTPEQEDTSTKNNEALRNAERKPKQPLDGTTPEVKDNATVSEQEVTVTQKHEISENEDWKPEQPSDSTANGVKDNRTASEPEATSENEEGKPEQPSDGSTAEFKDNNTVYEQEGTSTIKNETSRNEERKPEQPSDVNTPDIKNNSNIPQQEGTSTKRNETSGNEGTKLEQSSDGSTSEVKDESDLSEQEGISNKKNDTSEKEEKKSEEQASNGNTYEVKDKDTASEQEGTSTKKNETLGNEEKKREEQPSEDNTSITVNNSEEVNTSIKNNETSENEERKPKQTSDGNALEVKDNNTSSEQGSTLKKNETLEHEDRKPEQPSDGSTPEVKANGTVSEQKGTSTKKNETDDEERKPRQPPDGSTPVVEHNSTLPEEEIAHNKNNKTSEIDERKSEQASNGSIVGAKYGNNATENIGDYKTSRAEEGVADTRLNEHYQSGKEEREDDFDYTMTADRPTFRDQKIDRDSVVYGCYGFVEPKGKVRSTYYVYDSLGYHTVKPEEQFDVILGPLKVDSDERSDQEHQRYKRKVKQWNYRYFPDVCGHPVSKNREDTEMTTESSSTVDSEIPGVPERKEGSVKHVLESPIPSNDSGNNVNPGDEQPPSYEEGSGIPQKSEVSAQTGNTTETSHLESKQLTTEPTNSAVTANGENAEDELSSGDGGVSSIPQESVRSAEIRSTSVVSHLGNQLFTTEPPKSSDASGNTGDKRPPGNEGDSGVPQESTQLIKLSSTTETSHPGFQYLTVGPSKSSNTSNVSDNETKIGDEQPRGHGEGADISQGPGESEEINNSSETSHLQSRQFALEPPKPTYASENGANIRDVQPQVYEGGSGITHRSVESTQISNTSETSHFQSQIVSTAPSIRSNASENGETPEDKPSLNNEEYGVPQKSGGSTETTNIQESSQLESEKATSESPKPSNVSENVEYTGESSPGYEEGSDLSQKPGGSAEISSTPETSHLETKQVTSQSHKPLNVSGSRDNPGNELPSDHEEGSSAPQRSGGTAEALKLESETLTPEPLKRSNISGNGEISGDELSLDHEKGSGVSQKSGGSAETSSTTETTHLENQQNKTKSTKPTNEEIEEFRVSSYDYMAEKSVAASNSIESHETSYSSGLAEGTEVPIA